MLGRELVRDVDRDEHRNLQPGGRGCSMHVISMLSLQNPRFTFLSAADLHFPIDSTAPYQKKHERMQSQRPILFLLSLIVNVFRLFPVSLLSCASGREEVRVLSGP